MTCDAACLANRCCSGACGAEPDIDPERYGLYVLEHGHDLTLLATAESPAAIGVALFTQDDDCREAGLRGIIDRGPIGILDGHEHRWIVMPWQRSTS